MEEPVQITAKDFDINDLDRTTLEFIANLVWQFEFMCKNTKEGRSMKHAYNKVIKVLKHYIQKVSQS